MYHSHLQTINSVSRTLNMVWLRFPIDVELNVCCCHDVSLKWVKCHQCAGHCDGPSDLLQGGTYSLIPHVLGVQTTGSLNVSSLRGASATESCLVQDHDHSQRDPQPVTDGCDDTNAQPSLSNSGQIPNTILAPCGLGTPASHLHFFSLPLLHHCPPSQRQWPHGYS